MNTVEIVLLVVAWLAFSACVSVTFGRISRRGDGHDH